MWTLINLADDIRLSKSGLNAMVVDAATRALFGGEGVEKPAGEVRPLYKRKQSLRDAIRQDVPPFNPKGLVGVALPREDDEADVAPGDDGVGDETSQAGSTHEVIVLDGENDGGELPPQSRSSRWACSRILTPKGRRCPWRRGGGGAQCTPMKNAEGQAVAPTARRHPREGAARRRRRRMAPSRGRAL